MDDQITFTLQLESQISDKTLSIWPLQRQSTFTSGFVMPARQRNRIKDSSNDLLTLLIVGFSSFPTPVIRRISRNYSHRFHVCRKCSCQARLHLEQAGIVSEVDEFMRVVFEIIQLLKTVAVTDKPIARISHRQRWSFFTPKLKRS